MDQKPLVNIFKSHRKGSVCRDGIQLCHQHVHFKVLWCSGRDLLSGHAMPFKKIPSAWKKETEKLEKTIWFLHFSQYIEAISFDCLIQETSKDAHLTQLKDCLHKGNIAKAEKDLKPYRSVSLTALQSRMKTSFSRMNASFCLSHYAHLLSTKFTRVGILE